MKEKIVQSLNEIIDIVEEIPEKYQEIAFAELVKLSLKDSNLSDVGNLEEMGKKVYGNNLSEWETKVIESLPDAYLIAENGNRDEQTVWAVVNLWSREEDVNTESIRKVLRDELGITPQNVSNTARTLRNLVPQFLTRSKKNGKVYNYRPTRSVIKLFQEGN